MQDDDENDAPVTVLSVLTGLVIGACIVMFIILTPLDLP